MLSEIVDALACPHCAVRGDVSDLDIEDRSVLCDRGHSFDIARQGYVSLLTGDAGKITGDSAEMIAARDLFFAGGHFDPLVAAVTDAVAAHTPDDATVLEVGAGTGHYLAAVLDALPGARGIGLDISKPAARRVARAHVRLGAVVADVWSGLPVHDGSLSAVLCVFSPRNAGELHRALAEGGVLVVATPTERHQQELVGPLGLIRVDEDKARRLGDTLSGRFELLTRRVVEFAMPLNRSGIEQLVAMGPSARHTSEASRAAAIGALPEPFGVTASVTVGVYRRRASASS